MLRWLVAMVLFVIATQVLALEGPLGPEGTITYYELEADPAQRPEYERTRQLTVVSAELQLGPSVRIPSHRSGWWAGRQEKSIQRYQWFGLRWMRLNGQAYQMWILLDAWPTAHTRPAVARYLWQEPDWPDAVEFTHATTGQPLLPRLSLWHYGWPQEINVGPEGGKPITKLPQRLQLQGWPFKLVRTEHRVLRPPARVTQVALNPDLIVGSMTNDTDIHGKPYWALPEGKYEYRPTTDDDHLKQMEAGFTLFRAKPRPPWLTRSAVWDNNLFWLLDDWPAHLYRSNYWGRGVMVDEPAIHNRILDERIELAGRLTPEEAAKALQERLQAALWPEIGNYSKLWINNFIDQQFGRGNLRLVENDYPVWEAIWTTAWYQLAVNDGVSGIVDEDVALSDLVESYNRAFGTEIPPTVENACALRVAVLRGAARNFGKRWGVAFYSPTESRLKASSIPYLYQRGASYFWFWTGWVGITDNSGLPYSYQRYYASLVKQEAAQHPRPSLKTLLYAARTCIVIPYGYTFAPYPLQYLKWLHLERETGEGTTYRQVLTNAVLEAERCLRQGKEFDIAVEDPLFHPDGYDEIIYCRENGSVVVWHPDGEESLLRARVPVRPDLGPKPEIVITTLPETLVAPGKAFLKATATAGTGEFVAGQPTISWETYGPDQGVQLASGDAIEVNLPCGGTYRVRAAIADVFGRPAVAWSVLKVTEARIEAISLPTEWLFQTDPGQIGEVEGWQQPDFDDTGWTQIRVPAWWENTAVGAYTGLAWYRVYFVVPAELDGKNLVLEFGAVDEEAVVYLNGSKLGEHTVQSTGQPVSDIWDDSFTIRLPGAMLRHGQDNVLAVCVNNTTAAGGIFRPVRVFYEP